MESITYHRGSYCKLGGKFNLKKKNSDATVLSSKSNSTDAPPFLDPAPRMRPPPLVKAKEDEEEENDVIPMVNLLVVLWRLMVAKTQRRRLRVDDNREGAYSRVVP